MQKNKWRSRRRHIVLVSILLVLTLGVLQLSYLKSRASLGAEDSKFASALRISEVQNHNVLTLKDENGDAPGWIEIQNTGLESLSLHGLCLTRDQKFNKTLVLPDITLAGGECLLIYADAQTNVMSGGKIHAPFKLPKSGGTMLTLFDAHGQLIDSVAVPAMAADFSYARNPQGEWVEASPATPGMDNQAASDISDETDIQDVTLNEIVTGNVSLFPDERGDFYDYIELYNPTDAAISLKGYGLSDDPDKPSKFRFPDIALPAGECLAIHCSGVNDTSNPKHLHAPFRLSEGETVQLNRLDGVVISAVALPKLRVNQAYSFIEGEGWVTRMPPTPNMPNTADSVIAQDSPNSMIYISEIMALPAENQPDWVEIHNASQAQIDLSGCGLSDQPGKPRRWQFPEGTSIAPGERLTVFLTMNQSASSGYLVAPFALSGAGGEAICLSDASGQLLDQLYLPEQYSGHAYGRDESLRCGYFEEGTPLKPNGTALKPPRQTPVYSTMGGLYTTGDRLSITMTAPTGGDIYYTLDCSDPDQTKTLYTGQPIEISATAILRTRVYSPGALPSLMDTQSYLFDVHNAQDVPYVVSLVCDPVNLYSDETGIMVMGPNAEEKFPYGDYNRGANFWMEWEREAHVEVFAGFNETAISQECGIKLHGRNTRAYELKSFKVMAKSQYGKKYFSYPIFSRRPYDEYEAFILRYSGQDYKTTFMRDAVLSRQAASTDVMYMEYEECICYLNGEYYSAMYIRENISPFSLARREGWTGQADQLDLVKAAQEEKQGSNASYAELKTWLENNDNTTQAAYDVIDRAVDIDNFIDFVTLQVVYGTPDTVNVKRYRNPAADGKWRWVLYDLDRAMRGGQDGVNGFEVLAQGTNRQLFKAVMTNPALRERFLDNLNTALATYLSSQSLTEAFNAQFARIQPILPDYLENLEVTQEKYRSSYKSLLSTIRIRPALVLEQCAKYMKLSKEETLTRFADAYRAIEDFQAQSGK